MSNTSINVSCPTCKCSLVWSTTNKSRPFCSEKCRLIDLGEWASGSYSIPEETKVPDTYDDM